MTGIPWDALCTDSTYIVMADLYSLERKWHACVCGMQRGIGETRWLRHNYQQGEQRNTPLGRRGPPCEWWHTEHPIAAATASGSNCSSSNCEAKNSRTPPVPMRCPWQNGKWAHSRRHMPRTLIVWHSSNYFDASNARAGRAPGWCKHPHGGSKIARHGAALFATGNGAKTERSHHDCTGAGIKNTLVEGRHLPISHERMADRGRANSPDPGIELGVIDEATPFRHQIGRWVRCAKKIHVIC